MVHANPGAIAAHGVSAKRSADDLGPTRSEGGITPPRVSRKPALKICRQPGRRPRSGSAPKTHDREWATLMEAAQADDAKAYARLLRSIMPPLRGYVRRRWPSLTREDIEDLVQDVLLSVHAARATYSPDRPFMPWLFAIAGRRLVDRARRNARRATHEVQVEELPDASSDAVIFGNDTYRDPEALRKAVQLLPQKQRIAIEMLKLCEMSLKEASAATGMSIGALRVSVHRALPLLHKALVAYR